MIVSIVTRRTTVQDGEEWRSRLNGVLPTVREVLKAQPGFVSVEYLRSAEGDGLMAQVTRWRTLEDCQQYVREGGAATVALHEERALPTAPHPEGTWVRRTFEAEEAG